MKIISFWEAELSRAYIKWMKKKTERDSSQRARLSYDIKTQEIIN